VLLILAIGAILDRLVGIEVTVLNGGMDSLGEIDESLPIPVISGRVILLKGISPDPLSVVLSKFVHHEQLRLIVFLNRLL
jgi:hypothetical protein